MEYIRWTFDPWKSTRIIRGRRGSRSRALRSERSERRRQQHWYLQLRAARRLSLTPCVVVMMVILTILLGGDRVSKYRSVADVKAKLSE